jgi:3-keto-5-aminohexanoate cleavage enzyme
VSIGIGDHPYAELGSPRNADLVRRLVAIGRDCGREPSTPAETLQMLGMGQATGR